MKAFEHILLLGATGRTGRQVLKYALQKGYRVTALVRDPSRLEEGTGHVTVVQGTPARLEDLKAIGGFDAVISTLNNPRKSDGLWAKVINPPDLMTGMMKNIIAVMKERGISRIIVETAAGVGDSFDSMPLVMKWLINFTNLKVVYADHNGQEQEVMKSGLQWTLVRPVGLNNSETEKKLLVGNKAKHAAFISRKSVAKFMVDCLESEEYIGQKPIISEK